LNKDAVIKMTVRNRLRDTSSLVGGALAALLVTSPAFAQTAPTAQDEDATQVEEVIVTH
jgi:hypothetical protein